MHYRKVIANYEDLVKISALSLIKFSDRRLFELGIRLITRQKMWAPRPRSL